MENFEQVTERAANAAACFLLDSYGGQAPYLTAFSLLEPTPAGEFVAAGAWIAAYAARKNCTWDPDKEGPPGEHTIRGCREVSSGGAMSIRIVNENGSGNLFEYDAIKILGVEQFQNSSGDLFYRLKYLTEAGEITREDNAADGTRYYETAVRRGSCVTPDPGPTPTPPAVYNYTDVETGCTMNVSFKGWAVGAADRTDPVFEIESTSELRADGGRVGGCNFQPVLYGDTGGPGGPIIPVPPVPPGPGPFGEPWWMPFIRGAAQGIGALAAMKALEELFEAKIEPSFFSFVAPCDKKEDGTPQEVIYQFDEQNYQSRVLSQQAVIMEILQQHLNWKTPICTGNEGKGDYRTISFISDESSPDGNNRLRKRFRYRSQSGIGLDGVIDHWKDFTFNAGPVCVQHRGSALGAPQVWAASADEGKRVILHAAREAGIDPNQVGEWTVGGSDNPRYGMPGTMRVNTKGGYYWITSRLGENGRPLVGTT